MEKLQGSHSTKSYVEWTVACEARTVRGGKTVPVVVAAGGALNNHWLMELYDGWESDDDKPDRGPCLFESKEEALVEFEYGLWVSRDVYELTGTPRALLVTVQKTCQVQLGAVERELTPRELADKLIVDRELRLSGR